ncbi:hypothetical protein K4A83_08540 [Spirulina subsalsa FACHB-351]|uniref:STAS domain-containing protein n=1 Tax=Spirulina subsalsa FACHB-351 TaxID=234711 RepID=A0ABT3L494_9CYAN|nr:STAS domain-containing protein [Spirulina subsalsa]MCW6036319.1 hypothetical protein [Spirulina subsalsa FACHB-351]
MMDSKQIQGESYLISYDPATVTVNCQGTMRNMGMQAYGPLEDLLTEIMGEEPSQITLDLRGLKLLNSAGIRVLSKFIIQVRNRKTMRVVLKGSKEVTWQESSLTNLKRLMPMALLEWEEER